MSKLYTELLKRIDEKKYLTEREHQEYLSILNEVLNDICKYKDIEEELGCPIEVVFKALKNGIYRYMYFEEGNPVLRHYDELETDGEFLFFEYLRHDTEGQEEDGEDYLKDYKKTWWLKEDRSE